MVGLRAAFGWMVRGLGSVSVVAWGRVGAALGVDLTSEQRGRTLLRNATAIRVYRTGPPLKRGLRLCICREYRKECDCEDADGIKRPR